MTCSAMPSYASYSRWMTSRPRECARVVPMNVAIAPAASSRTSRDRRIDRQRLGRKTEVAARDRRDHRHLVSGRERLGSLDVRAIARIEKAQGLVAQPERGPHVADSRAVLDLDVESPRPGSLAEPGEQSDAYDHASQGIHRLPCRP